MKKQNNTLLELIFNIALPSFILMKLSTEDYLGPLHGLILALLFPLLYGAYELLKYKKYNLISILGFVSILITGGIGVMELDTEWIAIKEAAIPGLIAIVIFLSGIIGKPIIKSFLMSDTIIKTELLTEKLKENNSENEFNRSIKKANSFLSYSFVFSSVVNYFLAKHIVISPAGTSEFNDQLGQLTLWSYPFIALPVTLMMMAVFAYILKSIKKHAKLSMNEILKG